MINIKIDGKNVEAENGEMLLDVAIRNGFSIPALCYHESLVSYGACRLCLVEIKIGKRTRITTSCTYPVLEEIEVFTNSEKIIKLRKGVIKLLLSRCSGSEYIKNLANKYNVTEDRLKQDNNPCILCGLCVRACAEKIGKSAITFVNRGVTRDVSAPFMEIAENCIGCGACAEVCPTNCISIEDINGKRKIKKWNVDLKMVKCKSCGKYFTTEAFVNSVKDRNIIDESVVECCVNCKINKLAKNIIGGVGNG
jgi:NADH dehydrogenase/NADH:ubiquinone oxidoreductase subunit G